MAPQLVGWVTVGPWTLLLGAIAIGAVFGTVFGTFIGQSQREDDVAVTVDGLINGEILVAAYPKPQQVAMVEDVLQVHHARELSR
jgi:urea transporter